jgi:hypothetical protein
MQRLFEKLVCNKCFITSSKYNLKYHFRYIYEYCQIECKQMKYIPGDSGPALSSSGCSVRVEMSLGHVVGGRSVKALEKGI